MEQLVYLDEPGLQLYLTSDPDISTLLGCFIQKSLFDMFLQNVNNNLMQIIRKDYPIEREFQSIFAKKKFNDQDVRQYLGMSIQFGVFRFPQVNLYWHSEQFMRGGIEVLMPEGRYKFIENNMMLFRDEQQQQKVLVMVEGIRRKWKKIYRPDMELILYEQCSDCYTTYYLMDSETLFILDQCIVF